MTDVNNANDMNGTENSYDAENAAGEVTAEARDVKDIKLDVRVYPIDDPQGATLAFASVVVDDLVAIRGMRVVEGERGQFVAMPQSKNQNDGKYHDIAFPVVKGLRKEINRAVLKEFDLQMEEKFQAASADRDVERKPSLNDRIEDGKAKAAAHIPPAAGAGARAQDTVAVAV